MKTNTANMPIIAASTPARMESVPSDGPTVRSSRYLIPAGSAPELQNHRQILHFLLGEAALDDSGITDRFVDASNALNFVIQDDRETVIHVRGGECEKLATTLSGQVETHGGLTIVIRGRLRVTQISAGDS